MTQAQQPHTEGTPNHINLTKLCERYKWHRLSCIDALQLRGETHKDAEAFVSFQFADAARRSPGQLPDDRAEEYVTDDQYKRLIPCTGPNRRDWSLNTRQQPHTPGLIGTDEWSYKSGKEIKIVLQTTTDAIFEAWTPYRPDGTGKAEAKANAKRLVACWNAFDGVPTEEIASTGNARLTIPTLRADNARLRTTGKAVMSLIDDHFLVRNTNKDYKQNWSLSAVKLVKILKDFSAALGQSAEEEPGEDSPAWDKYKQIKERHEKNIDQATQSAEEEK